MIRHATCAVCLLALLAATAPAAPPVRPLDDILLDLGDAPLSMVKSIAAQQAKEQWEMDKGPLYKSAPPTLNGDPNKISDEVIFEGFFYPLSATSKLAIFSDDGCDVWIDGVRVLNNFKKGQHLPDLNQSLHVLDKFKPVAGRLYRIRVHYCNTIYNGKTDIDGCTLFGFQGGMGMADVQFINDTRGGDKVVVAKDAARMMPGGTKVIKVRITPANKEAVLKIKRKDNNTSGTASFEKDKEVLEKTVKNGADVTIFGRQISGKPRDIFIEASIDGKVMKNTFDFTVFRVDLSFLPVGQEVTDKGKNPFGLSFRFAEKQEIGTATVGTFFMTKRTRFGLRAGGLAQISGKIVPSGMDPQDFFRQGKAGYKPGLGFKMSQALTQRCYFGMCLAVDSATKLPFNVDNFDDAPDNSLGLDPNPEVDGKDLFIYYVDNPSIEYYRVAAAKGEVFRLRRNFVDVAEYARVPCSAKLEWHLAHSFVRKTYTPGTGKENNPADFVVDTTVKGDNEIGAGHIILTQDLMKGATPLPPFEITRFDSPQMSGNASTFRSSDPIQFKFIITGSGFPEEKDKAPRTLKIQFPEYTGQGQPITIADYTSSKNEIDGMAVFNNFDDRARNGVFARLGAPTKWQFAPDLSVAANITGNVALVDSLGQVIRVPLKDKPPAILRTGGNVDFTIGNVNQNVFGSFVFEIKVTKAPNKGPFTFDLKAEGLGVTGIVSYKLDSIR